jgi:hypothetical protein
MESIEFSGLSTDQIEQWLIRSEAAIAQTRANQLRMIAEIDRRQTPAADGCRSLREWVASRMDLAPETAASLVHTGRRLAERPRIAGALADGAASFDRVAAVARADADDLVEELDIAGVRRRIAGRRMHTRSRETSIYADRYLAAQPSLDESWVRLHGAMPGAEGMMVLDELRRRGDELDDLPDGTRLTRSQRNHDALVAMAQDSAARGAESDGDAIGGPAVAIFVDATRRRITGASVEYGPRVGPQALEEVLCTGSVQVVGIADGRPVTFSDSTRAIPPAVRRFVAARDGGCTADGCTSRYRLEPHHVRLRAAGGTHDPDNLRTLCWFHHHVVVHGYGFRIDPSSSVGRTRFIAPPRRRRPPGRDGPSSVAVDRAA